MLRCDLHFELPNPLRIRRQSSTDTSLVEGGRKCPKAQFVFSLKYTVLSHVIDGVALIPVKNVTKLAVYEATSVTPAAYHKIAGIRELGARGTFSGLCQNKPAQPQNNAFDSVIACLSYKI